MAVEALTAELTAVRGASRKAPPFVLFKKRIFVRESDGYSPFGFLPTLVPEGFQRASGKPFGAPAGARLFPCRGTDAPTPAREQSLQPYGAFTLFFRWRKKSVQKKASGTALQRRPAPLRVAGFGLREPFGLSSASVRFAHPPGKSPLLPILTAGLAMSRAMELDSFHQLLERARARLFPPSKWAGLFPSAAYRRSAPPQVALGRLKWRCLGRFCVAWIFLLHKRPA